MRRQGMAGLLGARRSCWNKERPGRADESLLLVDLVFVDAEVMHSNYDLSPDFNFRSMVLGPTALMSYLSVIAINVSLDFYKEMKKGQEQAHTQSFHSGQEALQTFCSI